MSNKSKKKEIVESSDQNNPETKHSVSSVPPPKTTTKIRNSRGVRIILMLIVAQFIFSLGVAVGDGRLSLPSFNGFKPVSGNLPNTLNYSSVNQVYQALKSHYDGKLTQTELLNGIKHGLAAAPGDPYTVYFTAAQARQFNHQLNNSFGGIGAELGLNSKGQLEIVAPLKGTPASKAGLQPKDLITSINGQSTQGMSVEAAVMKIRGHIGTKVKLQILRNNQTLNFTIARQNIVVPSVTTKILSGNIGYIQISSFATDTSSLMQQAAIKLKSQHVKGIILDLRNNPGGLLQAAINVSSLWLPNGQVILREKRGNQVIQTYRSTGNDILHGIPTVVLINGGSASASEITTGALHDHKDAYVIGQRSFGKGVVQQLINFKNGSELKVTIASWYRPDGQNIEHIGITPDQTVVPTAQDYKTGNDVQLKAAEQYLATH